MGDKQYSLYAIGIDGEFVPCSGYFEETDLTDDDTTIPLVINTLNTTVSGTLDITSAYGWRKAKRILFGWKARGPLRTRQLVKAIKSCG